MNHYKKALTITAIAFTLSFNLNQTASANGTNINNTLDTNAVVMESNDNSIFKPAALKSLEDYNLHYRLYKYDTISIKIIGFEDSDQFDEILIGTDGYVNLPYAGSVRLAGLTLDEAKDILTRKFSRYIKISDLSIMVKSYGPRKVQVLGEVNNPGSVELDSDDMNMTTAISKAGWVTTYGRLKKAQIIRIYDGTMYVKEANIKNYIEKHDITQNYALEDGDIIYIPKSNKIDYKQDILPIIGVYTTYKAVTD